MAEVVKNRKKEKKYIYKKVKFKKSRSACQSFGVKEWKNHKSRTFWSHVQDTAWLSKLAYWGIFFLKRFIEVAYGHFLPYGVEIELIFALRAAVSEIRADFQNYHIWAWNLEFEKQSQKLHLLEAFSVIINGFSFFSWRCCKL